MNDKHKFKTIRQVLLLAIAILLAGLSVPMVQAASSTLQNSWYQLKLDEQNQVVKFLNYFIYSSDHSDVDITVMGDAEILELLHVSGMHGGTISLHSSYSEEYMSVPRGDYEWNYYGYSYSELNKLSIDLFGKELSKKSNDYAIYKNEHFYLPDLAYGGDPSIYSTQPTTMYKLENNFYYFEFDIYGSGWGWSDDENWEERDYEIADIMVDQYSPAWTSNTKVKLVFEDDSSGYAILKKEVINGKPSWTMYQHASFYDQKVTLSDNQIDQFLNKLKQEAKPSSWAKPEVDQAISMGLVPQSLQDWYTYNITRAEFSELVVQLLTKKTEKTISSLLSEKGKKINNSAFIDSNDSNVLAAHALGIVAGKENKRYDPEGYITREEAAVMLTRTAKLLGAKPGTMTKFADEKQLADWSKDSVNFISSLKDNQANSFVMGSTGNNKFSPKQNYTKQQAYITIKRLYNAIP